MLHSPSVKPLPGIPKVAEAVKLWMPDASEEEQIEASENLRRYLEVIHRIVLQLEAEGRLRKDKKHD